MQFCCFKSTGKANALHCQRFSEEFAVANKSVVDQRGCDVVLCRKPSQATGRGTPQTCGTMHKICGPKIDQMEIEPRSEDVGAGVDCRQIGNDPRCDFITTVS